MFGMKLIMNTPGWRQRWHQRATPGASEKNGDGSGQGYGSGLWLGDGLEGLERLEISWNCTVDRWSFRRVNIKFQNQLINLSTLKSDEAMNQWYSSQELIQRMNREAESRKGIATKPGCQVGAWSEWLLRSWWFFWMPHFSPLKLRDKMGSITVSRCFWAKLSWFLPRKLIRSYSWWEETQDFHWVNPGSFNHVAMNRMNRGIYCSTDKNNSRSFRRLQQGMASERQGFLKDFHQGEQIRIWRVVGFLTLRVPSVLSLL